MKQTEDFWKPRLSQTLESIFAIVKIITNIFYLDIFIHLFAFQDAFGSARTLKTVGHEATLLSAGEFGLVDRWNRNNLPTIMPLFVVSTKANNPEDPNYFLRLITPSLKQLVEGVDMYCTKTSKVVRVFAVFSSVFGDLPGRCSMAGLRSNIFANRCCSYCDALKSEVKHLVRNNIEKCQRDPQLMKAKARMLGQNPMSLSSDQDAVGLKWGLTHYSELWEIPGCYVSEVLANDFMHCMVQGEFLKHFLKVTHTFGLSNGWQFFRDLVSAVEGGSSAWTDLSKFLRVLKVREFATEASF